MLGAPRLLEAAIIGKSKQSCASLRMSETNKPRPHANLSPRARAKAMANVKIPQLKRPTDDVKKFKKLIAHIVGMGISILKVMN